EPIDKKEDVHYYVINRLLLTRKNNKSPSVEPVESKAGKDRKAPGTYRGLNRAVVTEYEESTWKQF
ncbi:MAG: hypothetical protein ACM32O_14850, partial [Clostridia bacterium]